MAKQFTLGKQERLKSRKAIEQLFKDGQRFSVAPFRVCYLLQEGKTGVQFGAGVSAKGFRKAVDRNRIKRLTKEAWRLQKKSIEVKWQEKNQGLHLFFIFTGKELPAYQLVYEKVTLIIKKLLKLADEINPAHS